MVSKLAQFVLSTFLLIASSVLANSQDSRNGAVTSVHWTSTPENPMPIVTVVLDDGKPYHFILDTGAPDCHIDFSVARETRLPIKFTIIQATKERVRYIESKVSFAASNLRIKQTGFILDDMTALRAVAPDICGVIGMGLLDKFALRLDFTKKQIDFILGGNIAETKQVPSGSKSMSLLPNEQYHFYVAGALDGQTAKFSIDTGTGQTSICSLDLLHKVKPKAQLDGYTSIGQNQSTGAATIKEEQMLRFESLAVGDIVWKNPVLHRLKEKSTRDNNNLGIDFLQRYDAILDFPGRMMYLTPDPNYKERDDWVGIGMTVTKYRGKFVVDTVAKPSPASQAGLKVGDQILKIDGKKVSQLTLEEVNVLMHAKKFGDEINLEVQSDKKRVLSLRVIHLL